MQGIRIRFPGSGLSCYTRDCTPERPTPPAGQERACRCRRRPGQGTEPHAERRETKLGFPAQPPSPAPRPRARPGTRYLRRPFGSSRPRSPRPLVRSAAATSRPPLSRCAPATAHAPPAPPHPRPPLESTCRVLVAAPRGEAARPLGSGERRLAGAGED